MGSDTTYTAYDDDIADSFRFLVDETSDVNTSSNTNSSTTNSVTESNANASNTKQATHFQISAWDVEFPVTDGVDYTYIIRNDTSAAYFSSTAIADEDNCEAENGAIGVISRYSSPVTSGPLSNQTPIFIDAWYYYVSGPQATCSPDGAIAEQQSAGAAALKIDFAKLQKVSE